VDQGRVPENLQERRRKNASRVAAALLPKTDANKLIKLCQSASAPRVSFETTEREAA
jgi:hypothetical protein